MDDIHELLKRASWSLVRQKKHETWYCPCGEHRLTVPLHDGQSWRNERNQLAEFWRQDCPSVRQLIAEEEAQQPRREPHADGDCHFCGRHLPGDEYGAKWAEHSGIAACLRHMGVRQWHREECQKERRA